ncbi:MAG: YdcF family protein [Anaerolineae bacterium]|nr:YdcF family protein [Anaerolineae bacterium]
MKRLLHTLACGLGLLLLTVLLGFGLLCWQVDRYGRQDRPQQADAIVVLGAQVTPSGQAGSDLISRTYHGVDLYNAGWAPRLICTGGYAGDPLSAAAVACRFAISLGMPPEAVFVADGSMNTAGDARVTAELMRSQGWQSVILVSHPLHLYRARWSFRRAGLTVYTSPTTTDTGQIFPLLRLWYVVREAGALTLTVLEDWGVIQGWSQKLQRWVYGIRKFVIGQPR